MAPPKDIARSYPKRGLTADVGFRSEPKFCGDGAATFPTLSDYAQTAASADLALGETYTLCAWVRHVKPAGANHAVNIGVSGTIKVSISFFGGVSNPEVYVYNGANNMNTTGVFNSAAHTWYHIAIVIKPGAGNSQIFVNGIDRAASHSYTFPLSGSPVVHIGGDYSASNGDWEGDLANVALFTSSLTEDQVRQAMRASDYASHAAIATLEAFYPLSSDFNDSTGNHNATASGSPEFRPNRPQLPRGLDLARGAAQARVYTGRAVDFDGSADYLATETSSALGDTFTITAWIKRNTAATLDYVVNVGNPSGTGNAISISIGNTNPGLLYFFDNTTSVYTTNEVEYNTWYHVALTVAPGAGTAKLYMNGIDGTPAHSANINITDTTFEIGRYLGGSHWFYGWISDVRVYNQTLTADQVKELYHYPEKVLPTGVSASNLIHRWALSDYNDTGGTGGRYFQDSAGSNAMEDKGSASMSFAQPVPCPQLGLQQSATRLYFTGTTSNKVEASSTTVLGTSFAVGLWIQRESGVNLFLQSEPGSNQLYYSGTEIVYYSSTHGQNVQVTTSFTTGEWNHLLVTSSGLYLNGSSIDPLSSGTPGWSGTTATFGCLPSGGSLPFKGIMGSAVYWDGDLTAAEVLELYNQGIGYDPRNDTGNYTSSSDVVHYWQFDDLTTVVDRVGSANGTVSGTLHAASFPENASGSTIVGDFSMKRKGVSVLNCFNDPPAQGVRAEIPKDAGLAPSLTDGHAVSVWYRNQKQDTASANNGTLVTSGDTGTSDRFVLETLNGNSFRGLYGAITAPSTATISDNDWHHYAMVLDVTTSPNPTVRLYLDGVAAGTATSAISTTFPEAVTYIGWMNSSKSGFDYGLKGPLACPRIYAFQLSENEIKQIYNADYRLIRGLDNE